MTGQRVSLKIVAVVLLVALVAVSAVAGRTITTNGANVFVGEENLRFTAIPTNETVTCWVHYSEPSGKLQDPPWFHPPLRATNGVIAELGGDVPVGTYYVFTNADGASVLDWTSSRGYVDVQTPEVKLDVVLSNSRSDSVDGKFISRDDLLEFKLANNLVGLPGATMDIRQIRSRVEMGHRNSRRS